jgi:hypothetical protein
LPAPDLLLPGHPRLEPVPRAAGISPRQWQRLLGRGMAELQQLIERHAADGSDYLDGVSKEILPGLHYLGDLDGNAVYLLATPAHLLLFGAPGGDALPAWLDAKLGELAMAPRAVDTVVLTSCEPTMIAGLPALAARAPCRVVASDEGLPIVRPLLGPATELMSAAAFGQLGWIDVKALPLADVHPAATAYVVVWDGIKVLISGRMPIQRSPSECRELHLRLGGPTDATGRYRDSLYALRREQPQIWLPAVPLGGRNANLYDDEWDELLRFSMNFVRYVEDGRGEGEQRTGNRE